MSISVELALTGALRAILSPLAAGLPGHPGGVPQPLPHRPRRHAAPGLACRDVLHHAGGRGDPRAGADVHVIGDPGAAAELNAIAHIDATGYPGVGRHHTI